MVQLDDPDAVERAFAAARPITSPNRLGSVAPSRVALIQQSLLSPEVANRELSG